MTDYTYSITFRLPQGYYTIIDADDFEIVSKHTWRLEFTGRNPELPYPITTIKGKNTAMHRLLIGVSGGIVDHRNRNTLDNRKCNLKIVTRQQNAFNSFPRKGSSKYKGVSWDKVQSKWYAKIKLNDKAIALGRFKCEKDAARAYNAKAKKLFGEYAYFNEIE